MRKLSALTFVLVLLLACNLPIGPGAEPPPPTQPPAVITESPAPATAAPAPATAEPTAPPTEAPTTPPGTELNLGGVYMIIPPCLPVSAAGAIVPAQLYDPMGGPQEIYPQHRRINYTGYPLSGTFFEPFMRVFPVAEFATAWAAAGENRAADEVATLQALLTSRPPDTDAALPFLVMSNAGQMFHSNTYYLDFANGSGVRYLTSYGQDYVSYNNHNLFYTFQGLTSDGKYWISIIFPINHALLPANMDAPVPPGGVPFPGYSDSREADMTTYYATMKALMNSQPANSFAPALDCLDQYITSLNIGD